MNIKTYTIAAREFLQRIKSVSFLVYLILTPILLSGLVGLMTGALDFDQSRRTMPLGILDESGEYFAGLRDDLESIILEDYQPAYLLLNLSDKSVKYADSLITSRTIPAYLYIDTAGTVTANIRANSVLSNEVVNELENYTNKNILLKNNNMPHTGYRPLTLNTTIIEDGTGSFSVEEYFKHSLQGLVFLMLLIMVIIYGGSSIARSLIEEKSNKIIEILLSSVSPTQLLTGKVIGLSLLGFFQLFVWMGISSLFLGSSFFLDISWGEFILQLIFFILSYVLYNSVFLGFGSFAASEQEAQQITGFLSIFIILPIISAVVVLNNPYSLFSSILIYFPFTAGPAMMLRISFSSAPAYTVLTTILILIISIILLIIIASRIFLLGILSTGKRPSIKDIMYVLKKGGA